tara:strand:+ start:310 stop:561 length:252 start_codon:yes stop_codon:yes gene_type:complete
MTKKINSKEVKLVDEYLKRKEIFKKFEKEFKEFTSEHIKPLIEKQGSIIGDGVSLVYTYKEKNVKAKEAYHTSWHQIEVQKQV